MDLESLLLDPEILPYTPSREIGLIASGGVRLARAILAQSCEDLRLGHGERCEGHLETVRVCGWLNGHGSRYRLQARARIGALVWLFGLCEDVRCRRDHSHDDWPFSFVGVATVLQLEPLTLREALLRWDARGCPGHFGDESSKDRI